MHDIESARYALSRRRLLRAFGASALSAFFLPLFSRAALAQPHFATYPFQLGVAAGDPLPDGFVIWTRLAPDPMAIGHGMPAQPMEVAWEVAADAEFKMIARKGVAIARPELGHSVHVEVAGLEAARPYWYRFQAGTERSLTGRAKTTPRRGAPTRHVRFGVAGCQHYEQGLFTAHRKLAAEDLDFVFCYGDYIYEGRGSRIWNGPNGPIENVRQHAHQEIYSLDDYRRRYAQYKMDADLQAAHASAAWFMVWDDHETDNNWVTDVDQDGTPKAVFDLRRQAAVQAYYENMPLRPSAFPVGTSMQLYRGAAYGDLVDLALLDTRQYRSDQPCGDVWGAACGELDRANAEVLGTRQEAWTLARLAGSTARWKVLAQQVMMMDLDRDPGPAHVVNHDSWAGYRSPRNRLLSAIQRRKTNNVVVLTGDEHQNYAGELHLDGRAPGRQPIATEFVTTSISSGGDGIEQRPDMAAIQAVNSQLKFNNAQRGYLVCDVTPERWVSEFKVLDRSRLAEAIFGRGSSWQSSRVILELSPPDQVPNGPWALHIGCEGGVDLGMYGSEGGGSPRSLIACSRSPPTLNTPEANSARFNVFLAVVSVISSPEAMVASVPQVRGKPLQSMLSLAALFEVALRIAPVGSLRCSSSVSSSHFT